MGQGPGIGASAASRLLFWRRRSAMIHRKLDRMRTTRDFNRDLYEQNPHVSTFRFRIEASDLRIRNAEQRAAEIDAKVATLEAEAAAETAGGGN